MDYETASGSQFSLREIWTQQEGKPVFAYTTISAYVDGVPYTGKLEVCPEDIDEIDVLNNLKSVPIECIHSLFPKDFTLAPAFDPSKHYLKAPSFTFEDCEEGKTFVADCVLNEASVLEKLKQHPHPNIVTYYGCVVKEDRITHLSLKRYPRRLEDCYDDAQFDSQRSHIMNGIRAAVEHLHGLGLAHNDINPGNICIDEDGNAILIDFDGCLAFGEQLKKGVGSGSMSETQQLWSSKENDLDGLRLIEEVLGLSDDLEQSLMRSGDNPD